MYYFYNSLNFVIYVKCHIMSLSDCCNSLVHLFTKLRDNGSDCGF
jgi:hypothetical protein